MALCLLSSWDLFLPYIPYPTDLIPGFHWRTLGGGTEIGLSVFPEAGGPVPQSATLWARHSIGSVIDR